MAKGSGGTRTSTSSAPKGVSTMGGVLGGKQPLNIRNYSLDNTKGIYYGAGSYRDIKTAKEWAQRQNANMENAFKKAMKEDGQSYDRAGWFEDQVQASNGQGGYMHLIQSSTNPVEFAKYNADYNARKQYLYDKIVDKFGGQTKWNENTPLKNGQDGITRKFRKQ